MRRAASIEIITDEMSAQYPEKNRLAGAIRAGFNEAPAGATSPWRSRRASR